ncbi:MAG: hypothetical protein HY647_00535 [Acidobacteria bacterium]|nr:hypothetical protein [Acidobacteriota bacterium]
MAGTGQFEGVVGANSGLYPTDSASLWVGDAQYGLNSYAAVLRLLNTINNGGAIAFRTQSGGVFSDKVFITNDGNVGLGTTSPAEKLDVAGHGVFSGFLGLGGTAIHNDDDVGYVVCFFDNEANPFVNTNNEMRGFNATMYYTRNNNADANAVFGFTVSTSGTTVTRVSGPNFITGGPWNGSQIEIQGVKYTIASVTDANQLTLTSSAPTSTNVPAVVWQAGPPANLYPGLGWDVRPFTGAVVLKNMNLPSSDTEIRGDMKPFQSELFFGAKASGVQDYSVVRPTLNYVASLTAVDSSCTITTWAGYMVDSPCEVCGAANKVVNGYGVWVQDLDDAPTHTLVATNAAAIKIDGLNEYGRILWTNCSAYCPSSGVLQFDATSLKLNTTNLGVLRYVSNCQADSLRCPE